MDPNEWTPVRGWFIALSKAILRALIAFVIVTAGLYFAWPINRNLPGHWAILAVLFLISAAVGYPIGYAVANKLTEASGLAGMTILPAVIIVLMATSIVAYHAAARLRGESGGPVWFIVVVGLAFWSAAAAFKTLAPD